MIDFLKKWWPSIILTVVILWLTLARQPLPEGTKILLFPHADKVAHAIMMGTLTAVILFDARRAGYLLTTRLIAWVALGVGIFSCVDEWAQHLTGRTTEIADAIADIAGAIIAATVFKVIIGNRSIK